MKKIKKLLARKVHFWKLSVPVWTMIIAGALVVGSAGQAVGPVLSGAISGNVGLSVGGDGGISVTQALVLDTSDPGIHRVIQAEDWSLGINDEGSGFTAAIEAFEDKTAKIQLDLNNKSSARAYAEILLITPPGVTVLDADEVTSATGSGLEDIHGVMIARLSKTKWFMSVPSSETTGDLDIEISLAGNPGFHTIRAIIKQVTGG